MALQEAYCTIAEADAFLSDSVIWQAATSAEKDQALFWGRIWIDSNLVCANLDPTVPSENIKYANALLGEDYLDETLLGSGGGGSTETGVKRKKQKAGSVEQETEFFEGGGGGDVDYQGDVKMLLSGECSFSQTAGIRKLVRN